jgi:hypothetical protein
MTNKNRCLMIGVGGMAKHWITQVWHSQRERMAFAGLVDVNASALGALNYAVCRYAADYREPLA